EEVDGQDDASGLGHRAVLFAHSPDPQACPEHPDSARWGAIAYHRAHSQEPRDSVQTYEEHACHVPGVHTTLGWHDSAKRAITAQAPGAAAGAAAYEDYELHSAPDSASAAARARLRSQALQTQALHYSGQATVRGARCGQWWRLSHLPGRAQPQELLLTELIHVGDNPLPHAVHNAAAALGPAPPGQDRLAPARPIEPGVLAQARASGYAQHWRAVPRQSPWRPMPPSAPSAAGPQSAVVVGPDGQPHAPEGSALHTDRLGRIKVRFHWQAAQAAFPPGCGGEPRNEPRSQPSVWVRVAQRWAGAGMGTQFIPRIGQEVLVDFIERDLERPVVVGVLHNGRGAGGVSPTPGGRAPRTPQGSPFAAADDHRSAGQANDVAGGHSPAWHGAAAQPHAHAGALSGVQSRELGGLGANRLVFDDSPGQLRAQAATTAHATWLGLGHLLHQAGNRRGSARGLGLELRTDAYGALRGAHGLLLSSYGQAPHECAGDPSAGLALLHQAHTQADTLAQAAQRHHNATLGPTRQALQALQRSLQGRVSARWDPAAPSVDPAPPDAELPHSATALVHAQARAQQVWTAGQDVIASAEHSVHLGAGQDQHHSAGGAWRVHSGQALSVLAGAAPTTGEPAGLSLVAAQGAVQLQSQSDRLELAAQQAMDIQSAAAHLDATAARSLTLATAGGARITLSAQGLQVHCPGTLRIQAAQIRMLGARSYAHQMNAMPQAAAFDEELQLRWPFDETPLTQRRYDLTRPQAGTVRGGLNASGRTGLQKSDFCEDLQLALLNEDLRS
ncbi:type VI secretion system Vgr family protein, partial [Caldimonas sp.]|uniref:type VI secretion system Vgr family protein n=1 Tax=Caldimonas sp. TaxID=2838790 RepID=UPI00391AB63B